jgi:hypothetical protein
MAVAVEMNFSGATLEQYDQILERMGLTSGGPTPAGAISHWVAETDDGFRVVDVWESREAFDQYAQSKIMPYASDAGIEGMPETTFYEVHSFLTR